MPTKLTQHIYAEPGITRDGTPFDANTYIDGEWVRFYKNRPQKIGGYRMLTKGTKQIPQNLFLTEDEKNIDNNNYQADIYAGYQGDSVGEVSTCTIKSDPFQESAISLTLNVGIDVSTIVTVNIVGKNDTVDQSTTLQYDLLGKHTQDTKDKKYTKITSIEILPFSARGPDNTVIAVSAKAANTELLTPPNQVFYPGGRAENAIVVYPLNTKTNITALKSIDRSPKSGPLYQDDPLNVWSFDTIYGSEGLSSLPNFTLSDAAKGMFTSQQIKINLQFGIDVLFPVTLQVSGKASDKTDQTVILEYNGNGDKTTPSDKPFTSLSSVSLLSASAKGRDNSITGSGTITTTELRDIFNPSPQTLYATLNDFQNTSFVLAHVAPTANSNSSPYTGPQVNSSIGQIYYGLSQKYNNDEEYKPFFPMMQKGSAYSSGRTDFQTADNGICVIGGYIFALNNNGVVNWNTALPYVSDKNPFQTQYCVNYWNPNSFFVIGSQDFIYGAPVRVGNEIGGLFWTGSSLVRASRSRITDAPSGTIDYTTDPGLFTWVASYVSTITTCISAKSIVSYEPFFFWVGNDTFYQYNGAVSEVQNETNKQWFFNNLNKEYAAKITSFVNIQYQEWWILFPKGNAKECNHALVYNIKYNCWFDTPNINRSCAIRSNEIYQYPVMGSSVSDPYAGNKYPIFAYEYGYDADYSAGGSSGNVFPILSSFSTLISLEKDPPYSTNAITLDQITLDRIQVGEMNLRVDKFPYPNAKEYSFKNFTFKDTDTFLTMSENGTILVLTFQSNTKGGYYMMGKTLAKLTVSDSEREEPR